MELPDLIRENRIVVEESLSSQTEVLTYIAKQACKERELSQLVTPSELRQKLAEREAAASTGFENGVALPHCAIDGLDNFVIGLVVVPQGVDFDAVDGGPSKIFVYIIAPAEKRDEHIRYLSRFSKIFHAKKTISDILSHNDPAQIKSRLCDIILPSDVARDENTGVERTMVHIIIQPAAVLDDVLRAVSEIPDSQFIVLAGKNASAYLYKMPLFSSFWNSETAADNHYLIAVVPSNLSNDLLRRLNNIIADLPRQEGVIVFTTPISYTAGKINI